MNKSSLFRQRLLTFLIAMSVAIGAFAARQYQDRKFVLIINSYTEAAYWSREMLMPIAVHLAELPDAYCETVNLNSTLVRNDERYESCVETVFERYADRKPQAVVMIGNMAFCMRDRIQEEWGDIPILLISKMRTYGPKEFYYSGEKWHVHDDVLRDLEELRDKYNFTIVEVPDYYEQTIDMMMQMMPEIRKIVFLGDEIYLNRHLNHLINDYIKKHYPELEYEWLVGKDSQENANKMQQYLVNNDPEIGLLFSTWFYEKTNVHGVPSLISGDMNMIPAAKRPVFCLRSSHLELGCLGGFFADIEETQNNIRDIVDKMLAGESLRKVPFAYSENGHPIINYNVLRKNGMSITDCPRDTAFLHRPPTFWEQYSTEICFFVAFVLGLLTILGIYISFQQKRIIYLRRSNVFINNMPIGYAKAFIVSDDSGGVQTARYEDMNQMYKRLTEKVPVREETLKLFRTPFFKEVVVKLRTMKTPIRFNHHFEEADLYYEFMLCWVDTNTDNSFRTQRRNGKRKDGLRELEVDIFAINVTDKSKSEATLRNTTQKLNMTLNMSRIIPWRWNLRTHKIACEAQRILHSLNFHVLHDHTTQEFIFNEEDYLGKIHPDDKEAVDKAIAALVEGQELYKKLEFRLLTEKHYTSASGRPEVRKHVEWLEVNAAVNEFDEETKQPVGIIGSLLIITERKHQEQVLIAAREKAKESDRLKSVFLANMSHEIRTPLNAIVGFSNLMAHTEDRQKQEEFSEIINSNNRLLLQLINDLLDLAKIESNTLDFNYVATDVNQVMRSVEQTVKMRIASEVAFNVVIGAAECVTLADSNRVQQVLINFMTNAAKFTKQGSITLGYEFDGREIYFFVKDSGIGISPEKQSQLFQRFSKLNNFEQGNGLGLSICKSIVETMGGQIGVQSRGEGFGSTFWFTLPYHPVERKKTEVVIERKEVAKDEVTILIAEDKESNYLLLRTILLSQHYKLIHAWDGEEAVKLCREYNPQLVLMDINMPEKNGYEATAEIRQFNPTVPIIAITAYALDHDRDKAMAHGFDGYMSKPIAHRELIDQIKELLNKTFVLL